MRVVYEIIQLPNISLHLISHPASHAACVMQHKAVCLISKEAEDLAEKSAYPWVFFKLFFFSKTSDRHFIKTLSILG